MGVINDMASESSSNRGIIIETLGAADGMKKTNNQ